MGNCSSADHTAPQRTTRELAEVRKMDRVRRCGIKWRDTAKRAAAGRDRVAGMLVQPIIAYKPNNVHKEDIFHRNVPEHLKDLFTVVPHKLEYDSALTHSEQPVSFLNSLEKTWHKASKAINGEDFELFFPYKDRGGKPKSERWVSGLLLENCPDFLPSNIQERTYCYADRHDHENDPGTFEADHIVVVDDASYSASQIHSNLEDMIKEYDMEGKTLHLVIPCMSHKAKKILCDMMRNIESYEGSDINLQKNKNLKIIIHTDFQNTVPFAGVIVDEDGNILDRETNKERYDLYEPRNFSGHNGIGHTMILSHKRADMKSLGRWAGDYTKAVEIPYKTDGICKYDVFRANLKRRYNEELKGK